jgi:hypothetical protein
MSAIAFFHRHCAEIAPSYTYTRQFYAAGLPRLHRPYSLFQRNCNHYTLLEMPQQGQTSSTEIFWLCMLAPVGKLSRLTPQLSTKSLTFAFLREESVGYTLTARKALLGLHE